MRIFLSHRSRYKPLVREFRAELPRYLDTWLDEDSLLWGDSFPAELRSSIQSGVDFLIIFLDNDALSSEWVKQELKWAIEREKELNRTFVLPILLEEVAPEKLPPGFSERLSLRLSDFEHDSVVSLAKRATLQLFQLVVESFSSLQLEIPGRREPLTIVRDQLSAGQARLLAYVVKQCKRASEVTQREIESTMGASHSSPELFYRLESLIAQGFLLKRRIPEDGQYSYRLSDDFKKEV
jgi:TIR domain-containing protein